MNIQKIKEKRIELEFKKLPKWKFRNYKRNWNNSNNDLSKYGMTREDDALWAMAFDWGSQ